MKKTAALILVLVLALTLLGGCLRLPKNVQEAVQNAVESANVPGQAGGEEEPDEPEDNGSAGVENLTPAKNPSESYNNYLTVKSAAMDRIYAVSEESDALSMSVAMNMLGISMIDLSLLSLTAFTGDAAGAEMALGFFGMENVKISGGGNDFTITYNNPDGEDAKQTCQYDPGKDSLKSILYDGEGKISVYFEFVHDGDAYTAQYYYAGGDGYEILRAYFDSDNVAAFGNVGASGEPDSIYGKSGFNEDFVINDNMYMILADGTLTVFDDGTTTTN